jgi:hypothetical protein
VHYSAAPRSSGKRLGGVPRTRQFLVTLTVHTNKINPARHADHHIANLSDGYSLRGRYPERRSTNGER